MCPESCRETQTRRDIVEVCRRVYSRGWLAATDGNASVLLPNGYVLTTPAGIHKGYMNEHDLVVIDRAGKTIDGNKPPSSEIAAHLAAYEERGDIRSVLHAHPTNCIALSLADVRLDQCLLPEVVIAFGSIPTAAYATPGSHEVAVEMRKWVRNFDAVILERHGSITVGANIYDAYNKLERLEHVAEITFRARLLSCHPGYLRTLTCEQLSSLQSARREAGLPERTLLGSPCDTYAGDTSAPDDDNVEETVHRVRKMLSIF